MFYLWVVGESHFVTHYFEGLQIFVIADFNVAKQKRKKMSAA
jgi:hypothetical protein